MGIVCTVSPLGQPSKHGKNGCCHRGHLFSYSPIPWPNTTSVRLEREVPTKPLNRHQIRYHL